MVRIERFQQINIQTIQEWLKLRSLPQVTPADLPRLGFLAYVRDKPVAAAFLRRCDGNVGIFDSLVTDPRVESSVRHLAIESLIKSILEVAKELKINHLLAFSIDTGTLERGRRHGFVEKPYTVLSLRLTS